MTTINKYNNIIVGNIHSIPLNLETIDRYMVQPFRVSNIAFKPQMKYAHIEKYCGNSYANIIVKNIPPN